MSILTGNKFDPNTDIPDLTGKVPLTTIANFFISISAHE